MSKVSIQGDASGTGTLTIAAPNTNSNYTLTLPTNTGTVMTSASDTFSGGLTLGGDLTLDSNGIYLGGTGAANYLDDYETGTWTPNVIGTSTAGSGTYTAQNGRYTKVGNLVTATAYLYWTAHTGTGNMQFSGLPFTVLNASNVFYGVSFGIVRNVALTANNVITAYAIFNQSKIDVAQYPVGGGNVTSVALDTSAEIIYTITYIAS